MSSLRPKMRSIRTSASTGALIVVQGREVLGTIAQQRHTLFGKVSEHQFAGLARSNRLEGLRIYNLGEIMVFVEVSAVLALALVPTPGPAISLSP